VAGDVQVNLKFTCKDVAELQMGRKKRVILEKH
jgi:hypothetical protein